MEKGLCELCNPKQWKTVSTSELTSTGYPVYGANGVIGYYSNYNHDKETLLITCRGATCGTLNICKPFSYINGNAMALDDLSDEIDIKYLYYFLLSRGLSDTITGSAQPQIVRQSLKNVRVIYPNLDAQKRIIYVLGKADELLSIRKQQIAKLDELVKAQFMEMFGDDIYPKVKVSRVCDFITKGTTPPNNLISEKYSSDKVPYLKVYNLSFTGKLLFDTAPQYVPENIHNGVLARSKVYPNDVLMNIVGPPLGKFALVTDEFSEWNINQAIAIFRAKEKVNPKYLLFALMQPEVLKPFLRQAVGIRQLNLSLAQCRDLEIPLPPLSLQSEFAAFVERVDQQKQTVQQSHEKLELMKKALMQEYFG